MNEQLLKWEQDPDGLVGVGPDDWSVTIDPTGYWVVWHRRDEWADGTSDSPEQAQVDAEHALRESMMEYLEDLSDDV